MNGVSAGSSAGGSAFAFAPAGAAAGGVGAAAAAGMGTGGAASAWAAGPGAGGAAPLGADAGTDAGAAAGAGVVLAVCGADAAAFAIELTSDAFNAGTAGTAGFAGTFSADSAEGSWPTASACFPDILNPTFTPQTNINTAAETNPRNSANRPFLSKENWYPIYGIIVVISPAIVT